MKVFLWRESAKCLAEMSPVCQLFCMHYCCLILQVWRCLWCDAMTALCAELLGSNLSQQESSIFLRLVTHYFCDPGYEGDRKGRGLLEILLKVCRVLEVAINGRLKLISVRVLTSAAGVKDSSFLATSSNGSCCILVSGNSFTWKFQLFLGLSGVMNDWMTICAYTHTHIILIEEIMFLKTRLRVQRSIKSRIFFF